MKSFVAYLREIRDELKKVRWPSRETTVQHTTIVVVSVVVMTAVFGTVDFVLTELLNRVISL